jgi:hypothetical protein
MINDESPSLAQIVYWTLLAGVGGAVKYLVTTLKNPVANVRHFVTMMFVNTVIGTFSGFMAALFISTFTPDKQLQWLVAGGFGYLGTQGIDIITLIVQKKVGAAPVALSSVIPVPPAVDPAAQGNKQ